MRTQTPQSLEPIDPVPLSPIEGMFWRLEEALAGSFRVVVLFRLEGSVDSSLLCEALERLQRRHPKLRAVIGQAANGFPVFQFDQLAPPIPFEIKDSGDVEPAWREEARRLLQERFSAAGPLAAVCILRSRSNTRMELFLAVHHAIADGMAAIMLVHDLLSEYAAVELQTERAPLQPLAAVSAPRANPPGGWMGRIRLIGRFLRIQREERRGRQTMLPEAPGIPSQSQWVHWIFTRQETVGLVRRCRKERTSLSGALVAAVACGLMDCLPLPEAVFKCTFPFDLRDELDGPAGPVTAHDLGCFASIMNEYYVVKQTTEFWDLARRAQHQLQVFVRNGGPGCYYNLAGAAMSRLYANTIPKLMPPAKRVTLLATNYGVINIRDAYGSLRPLGGTLIFRNDVIGPSLVMEALVMGQKLNIGLAADSLEPLFWEKLQVAVRKHLEAATGTGESGSIVL